MHWCLECPTICSDGLFFAAMLLDGMPDGLSRRLAADSLFFDTWMLSYRGRVSFWCVSVSGALAFTSSSVSSLLPCLSSYAFHLSVLLLLVSIATSFWWAFALSLCRCEFAALCLPDDLFRRLFDNLATVLIVGAVSLALGIHISSLWRSSFSTIPSSSVFCFVCLNLL